MLYLGFSLTEFALLSIEELCELYLTWTLAFSFLSP
jgi:hypothetical protein